MDPERQDNLIKNEPGARREHKPWQASSVRMAATKGEKGVCGVVVERADCVSEGRCNESRHVGCHEQKCHDGVMEQCCAPTDNNEAQEGG